MIDNFDPELDLRDLIQLNVSWITFFGYFCPDYKTTVRKICYYVYSLIFAGFFYGINILSEIANMVVAFGDIEKMSAASFLLLTHIVHFGKIYVFMRHNSKVRSLINSINRKEFKPKNLNQHNMLMEDIKMSKTITKVFLFMGFATCALWAVFPYLDKMEDDTVRLPLSGWYPFETDKAGVFEFIYFYQSSGALFAAMANISMDTFLSGSIMVISGQLAVLNNSLQIMEQKFQSKGEYGCVQDVLRGSLLTNVIHYRNIIQFADDMTELFTMCIMAQFAVSVIIICITMFQMSLVSVLSLQFLSLALYQACMVLEIFLWCYFGNEVILRSEKLTESAYKCQWMDSSKEFKNNLLFFMTRSQVPLKLYAGGYFPLSLDTFKAIVKSSWSYFAVLNRVHSEE